MKGKRNETRSNTGEPQSVRQGSRIGLLNLVGFSALSYSELLLRYFSKVE